MVIGGVDDTNDAGDTTSTKKKDELSSCIIYNYDQSWSVMITYDQS